MIEAIEFRNFKVLRDSRLPLGRCTILVGPNGSGKSTVLEGIDAASSHERRQYDEVVSLAAPQPPDEEVQVRLHFGEPHAGIIGFWGVGREDRCRGGRVDKTDKAAPEVPDLIRRMRVYAFDAGAICKPVPIQTGELGRDGAGLAAVLSRIQNQDHERFEALNLELSRWLPEFDRISFDDVSGEQRVFFLRARGSGHRIPAQALSQGTLIAMAILTLAYLPDPPSLVALEEPDRGIHPRLLRHVQDALYRLAYPESAGEKREPVQVLATTHSPYFLDLFREHPEEVVIANRNGDNVTFERLSERADIKEILGDAPLGEAWYTGVLGGIPTTP